MRTTARLLLISVVTWAAGCATYSDHLKAGRYAKACLAASEDVGNWAHFNQWVEAHTQARLTLVPVATAEQLMGGPLAEYGDALGLYELEVTSPGSKVNVQNLEGEVAAQQLLSRLPPLVVPAEPVLPPGPVDATEFAVGPLPSAPSENSAGTSGLLGGALGALAGAAWEVGKVLGGIIMFPAAMTLGILLGGIDVIRDPSALLRPGPLSGGSGAYSEPPRFDVPIYVVRPTKVAGRLDALLYEHEYQALTAARQSAWERLKLDVALEHQRRIQLAENLDSVLGICRGLHCRYLRKPGAAAVVLSTDFTSGEDTCPIWVKVPTEAPRLTGARPPWPPPGMKDAITVEDLSAPGWAVTTAATSSLAWNGATAALQVRDLLCTATVGKAALVRGEPPLLSVRVTVGRDEVRLQRWFLGPVKKSVTFVVPSVHLQPGERLRMSFADAATHRHLGGGLVELVGTLPLTVRSDAVEARCTEAPAAALMQAGAALQGRVTLRVNALAAALQAQNAPAVAQQRLEARQALVALAMHAGWRDPVTVDALRSFSSVDPAEHARP